jgi:hypothetical protein
VDKVQPKFTSDSAKATQPMTNAAVSTLAGFDARRTTRPAPTG